MWATAIYTVGFLGVGPVKMSAQHKQKDERDEHSGLTSDSTECWTPGCNGKMFHC